MRSIRFISTVVMVTAWTSVAIALVTEPVRTYEGYKVVRVWAEADQWKTLLSEVITQRRDHELDVWRYSETDRVADLAVSPAHFRWLVKQLRMRDLTFEVTQDNLGKLIRQEKSTNRKRRKRSSVHLSHHNDVTTYFPRYDELLFWMEATVRRFKGFANILDIGPTAEGRRMKVLKLGIPGQNKWKVWLDAGIHGREWIAPTTLMYIAGQLLKGLEVGDNSTLTYLERLDWYFLPVANPDGYEYTHVKNRLWRKNRNRQNESCIGVDLNRNWAFQWGGPSSSSDPCSNIYRGSSPEVEPEVANIVHFLQPRADAFIAYVTYHSYGQRFTTRWDYTETIVPKDHQQLLSLAERAVEDMGAVYGVQYDAGRAPELMYAYGGGSPDWARAIANIKYSYLIELRDKTTFLLPPHEIVPTGEENWAGVKVITQDILEYYSDIRAPARLDPNYDVIDHNNGYNVDADAVHFSAADSVFQFMSHSAYIVCVLVVLQLLQR